MLAVIYSFGCLLIFENKNICIVKNYLHTGNHNWLNHTSLVSTSYHYTYLYLKEASSIWTTLMQTMSFSALELFFKFEI